MYRFPLQGPISKMTLARLLRAHVQMGSIHPKTVILADEVSLLTLQDWQEVILPLVALGAAVWLVGDMANQLHAIGSQWHGQDMTADWSEHPMVIAAVGRRLTLTEGHRCDARLFHYLSSLAASEQPLGTLLDAARAAFPPRGRPAKTNIVLCHVTRKRVITVAQRRRLRADRPAAYLTLEGAEAGHLRIRPPNLLYADHAGRTLQ